ncbi:Protein of unknown function DUF2419 domain-containing protein [Rozella allomycis CSF55]|uniref:Queuosine 5'-phosphate N-glycosylase/hydrolase n=1 Tax=Rozella allomycis (strain CSF55) TaxID=988480 RepID=A0A075AX87_ROZAC|nr:Protein of unknown function DUF2419 domain-containing protein [Rozella allomycis CSF55]|eukprot:EPZ34872.1 Protein of unknown function DUF2419 domain-containing protein [Rozella allomycis CSF55]
MTMIFLIDLLNFSFWNNPTSDPFMVNYQGKDYSGYASLCAIIKRAIDEDYDMLNPHFWCELDLKTWAYICRSTTNQNMPLLEKRLEILKESGSALLKVLFVN